MKEEKENMNKKKVMKELCLLLVFALIVSLGSVQTAFAANDLSEKASDMLITTNSVTDGISTDSQITDGVEADSSDTDGSSADVIAIDTPTTEPSVTDTPVTEEPTVDTRVPILQTDSVYLVAGGDTYELQVKDALSASFAIRSEDTSVVSLSNETAQSVTITPLSKGHAVLTVTAIGHDQNVSTLTCKITVSELSVSKELVEIYMNDNNTTKAVALRGANLDAVYYGNGDEWEESLQDSMATNVYCSVRVGNDEVANAYCEDGYIYIQGLSKGTTNVRLDFYGVKLSIKVKVYHYTLNKYTINTYVGSPNKTLKVKGAGNNKVTWNTGKTRVATVSSKGVVTIHGIGTTKITAKVNGRRVFCIVSVSSKTACRVVKKARAISNIPGIQYSQAMRMSDRYYDCSSLVYRCYRDFGIRFGYTHPTWAPTAADEGRWCMSTNHVVSNGSTDILNCRMVPGDTIYYSFNGNNGRYLNIDHTAIFSGYEYDENIGYYGNVIEASSSRNGVVERMYLPGNSIQLIGRPSKQ